MMFKNPEEQVFTLFAKIAAEMFLHLSITELLSELSSFGTSLCRIFHKGKSMYKLTPLLTLSLVGKHMFGRALLKQLQIYASSHGPVFLQKHMYATLGVNYLVCAMNLTVSKMFYMIVYPQKAHSTSKGSTNTGV